MPTRLPVLVYHCTLPALFSFMSFAAARIVSLGFTATRLDVMMSPAV